MNQEPYPYCVHGAYVGGCGIDYMCHSCEMGDEADSINDLKAHTRRKYGIFAEALAVQAKLLSKRILWDVPTKYLGEITSLKAQIDYIRQYTTDDDDREWIYKAHEKRVREWNAASGDDQFNSLPEHVLEGSY